MLALSQRSVYTNAHAQKNIRMRRRDDSLPLQALAHLSDPSLPAKERKKHENYPNRVPLFHYLFSFVFFILGDFVGYKISN